MKIIAIDLGTANIGWAIADEKLEPELGTYHPPGTKKNIGWLLADLRSWLAPLLERRGITHLVYESPILQMGNNPLTIRKMHALGGMVELIAYDAKIPVEEALPQTVRLHFLGRGATPRRRDEIKRAVIKRCEMIGWRPENDDEADAAALLHYAICTKTSRVLNAQGALL